MSAYDHKAIEKKWQKRWAEGKAFEAKDAGEKEYLLIEFPYPSGDGLHVGHIRSWTALDVVARKRRAQGKNVLYPIGWDAFGLPTENYALKTGKDPRVVTKENTDNFRRQIKSLGISFDWAREINTTDPAYYKWTQWIFLQLYKKGLAYKAKTLVNWCPKDKIGLANEEVVNGTCERCGTPVEKKEKEQWMLAITKYAQRLYDDLGTVDYIPAAKMGQRNWIGPSEGAEIEFKVSQTNLSIKVFTTRPDTLFGATYMVLAPEHPLVEEFKNKVKNWPEIRSYVSEVVSKSEIERTAMTKDKSGLELKGIEAINPVSNKAIPVFIADYVLMGYGTGAIMAVPAHDDRDFHFALKYDLPIQKVVERPQGDVYRYITVHDEDKSDVAEMVRTLSTKSEAVAPTIRMYHLTSGAIGEVIAILQSKSIKKEDIGRIEKGESFTLQIHGNVQEVIFADVFAGDGIHINSSFLDGLNNEEAIEKITQWLEKKGLGQRQIVYKLRDWVFSRQRYWGEPIPMVFCENCALSRSDLAMGGWVPVPENDLPVLLPKVEKYQPSETGESPLANIKEFVETACPECGGPARRETDVMPNWAGSSWYYLRYADPGNKKEFASKEKLKYWTPVNWYNGGMEHTTLHLLYSRFWHKVLFDLGLVPTNEPYAKRTSHGLILAKDGSKMSKSKGNVINPDSLVEQFGADSLRLFEMFLGPFDQPVSWNSDSIAGVRRFLEKVWKLQEKVEPKGSTLESPKLRSNLDVLLAQTIDKVSRDIEALKMNTAVSSLMIFANHLQGQGSVPASAFETLLQLLAPFAPHLAAELWAARGKQNPIEKQPWPIADPSKLTADTITIAVQINGKVRATIELPVGASQDEALVAARENEDVKKWLVTGKEKKTIYVPGKIINFVVGSPLVRFDKV